MSHRFVLLLFLVFFSANSIAGVVISAEIMTSHLLGNTLQASNASPMSADCHRDRVEVNQEHTNSHDNHEQCNDCQFCFVHIILTGSEPIVISPSLVFNARLKTGSGSKV